MTATKITKTRFSTSDPPRTVADVHSVRELPVPPSLLNSVACSRATFELILALIDRVPLLEAELAAARRKGAVHLARAYVVLYKLDECLRRLYGDSDSKDGSGAFRKLFERYKKEVVPAALDAEGVPSIPLDEGMRVGTRTDTRASVRGDAKPEAYAWLRENYPDLLATSVNASTLSSLAGKLMSEDNVDLPEDLFNVAYVETTTVTVARGKK